MMNVVHLHAGTALSVTRLKNPQRKKQARDDALDHLVRVSRNADWEVRNACDVPHSCGRVAGVADMSPLRRSGLAPRQPSAYPRQQFSLHPT